MGIFYKTIGIVAFFCVSQSAFSAFPDDLYGFKLGDSTDTTLNKLKNKYGKITEFDSGDEISKKCGRGIIPINVDENPIKIGNGMKIRYYFLNHKVVTIRASLDIPVMAMNKKMSI